MRIPILCAAVVISGAAAVGPVASPASADATVASTCAIPQMIAHRGGGGVGKDPYFYENSWKAFENSLALGVKVIETDVRWTVDNVPIIMHDDELARTTTGTGLVSTSTIEYIKSIELKNGAGKIPMFEDVLTWAKTNNLQVWPEYKPETDNQVWINDYAAKVTAAGTDIVVPSFKKPELEQFKTLLPNFPQIWFQDPLLLRPVVPADVAAGAYAGIINVNSTTDSYATLAKAGTKVFTWYNILTGGDNPDGWAKAAAMKPVGIITDYPQEYQQWAATTTYCAKPKAKCAKLPKKLKADSTVVLLKKTCKTSAGTKVTVSVKGKGKLKRAAKGKVSIVTGAKGKVTITYAAEGSNKAAALNASKKYTLK
jgi:glycerophosphoryl diester phosphodiesterase